MLRTQRQDIHVHTDPLSFSTELKLLAGNNVQTFNQDLQEFMPDRTFVPAVVLPEVFVEDPYDIMSGQAELSGAEWYIGHPTKEGTNRIVSGTDFEISDGTQEGFPKYALKVKKNVPADTPIDIYCIYMVIDKRQNTEVRFERSMPFYSSTYDSKNYSVTLDCPDSWSINPLEEVADDKGNWAHKLTSQLRSGQNDVPDENAAYWWQINDIEGWRDMTEEEIETLIVSGYSGGVWSKSIVFDARMVEGKVSFRVRAAYYEDVRPQSPASELLQQSTSVRVEMPRNLEVKQVLTKGARVEYDMKTPVGYRIDISVGNQPLADKLYSFFDIIWYSHNTKPGSKAQEIGRGRTINFIPTEKGALPGYGLGVYAEIKPYSHHQIVTDGTDTIVTAEGDIIIEPAFA